MGPAQDDPLRRSTPASGSRRWAWRALASALAGGGLTAATLGGPIAGALAAEGPTGVPTSTEGALPPVPPPAEAQSPPIKSTPVRKKAPSVPQVSGSSTPPNTGATAVPEAPTVVLQHKQKARAVTPASPTVTSTHAKPTAKGATGATGAAGAAGANNVAPPPALVAAQINALAAQLAATSASAQALAFYRIPLFLLPIYQAAAEQYGVPWQILAAINEIETDYGNDLSVSTAGAIGWMQFMPSTWLQYGVDALNAGYADPYNPVDAIFAAARYLRAAGAATNLPGAIFSYNHSQEYVASVLLRAKLISTYPQTVIATLTGLTDDRLPVTGNELAWASLTDSSSSATAGATPLPSVTNAQASENSATPAGATGQSAAQSLGSAPIAPSLSAPLAPEPGESGASSAKAASAQPLQLAELLTQPNAQAVAVQDGRVLQIGSSHKLGKYVVLQDIYGDVFTYAGLGSIAPTYRVPKPSGSGAASGEGGGGPVQAATAKGRSEPAPKLAASAGRQLPLTLSVKGGAGSAGQSSGLGGSLSGSLQGLAAPASGKVRLFAHPGNPDARAAAAIAKRSHHSSVNTGFLPLRAGAVVAKGTVLGRVSTPREARDGHLRFAIRPAGDQSTIDPRPILRNWEALDVALHPQGVHGEPELVGATASGVFLLSKGALERDVLADPGISIPRCGRQDIAAGAIDKRVLAVLAFLSRSGLKPTVSTLRCGRGADKLPAFVAEHQDGDAVDITAINGMPVAAHQGPGTITDAAIRTLLTLRGEFAPAQIASLMHYPGSESTMAVAENWNHIHVGFHPVGPVRGESSALSAHAARRPTRAALLAAGNLSSLQWSQLVGHIGALPAPALRVTPSSSAIPDPKR